jgi:hypothetical protein
MEATGKVAYAARTTVTTTTACAAAAAAAAATPTKTTSIVTNPPPGLNFAFDKRTAVAPAEHDSARQPLSHCILCRAPWDTYLGACFTCASACGS